MNKRELIEELIRLTKLQRKSLEDDNVEGFIALLDKRQMILDRIEEIHEAHPETRLQREEELVAELRKLDEENQIKFKRKFEEVKNELRKMRQLKTMEQRYTNHYDASWEEGMYFDKKEKR